MHIATSAVHTDPAAVEPLKSDSHGIEDADDTSDEEAVELQALLQQISDPAVRCEHMQAATCQARGVCSVARLYSAC
jgi:hypothetical protein